MLTFQPDGHVYRWNGQPVPSVTTVLGAVYRPFEHCDLYARDRGTYVHEAIALMLEGDLDWDSLRPDTVGFVTAASRAIEELGLFDKPELAFEVRMFSERYRFAGTADVVATVDPDSVSVVDWKTGEPGAIAGLQLAGYAIALEEQGYQIRDRVAVKLNQNGTFKCHLYNDPGDAAAFKAALLAYRWGVEKGYLA